MWLALQPTQLKLGSMQPLTEGPGLGVDMCSHNLRNLWQLVEEAVSLTMHISYPSAVCKLTQTKIDTAEIYCISIAVSRLYKILRHYWSMNCLRGPCILMFIYGNQVIFNDIIIIKWDSFRENCPTVKML